LGRGRKNGRMASGETKKHLHGFTGKNVGMIGTTGKN
jgi:hypothetical protein